MSNVQFRPVRGTEASILNAPIREGRVYFATDSGKMFMDKDNSRIPIGGGTSSIHYGKKHHAETPSDSQIEFDFSLYEIEGNEVGEQQLTIPNPDDLILNIPDGCFYRVLTIDRETEIIHTGRLTIAGSGSGGGTNENVGKSILTRLTPNNITVLSDKEYKVGLNYYAIDGSGNLTTGNVKYEVIVNDEPVDEGYMQQGDKYFDVTKYLTKETNKIAITVYTDIGDLEYVPKTLRWEIKTTKLILSWNYDESQANNLKDEFKFKFSVTGNVDKKVHIQIGSYPEIVTDSFRLSTEQTLTIKPSDYFQHGAIPVTMYASAELEGADKPEKTLGITKQMIFYDESIKTPIISCGLHTSDLNQYDTVYIPIVLYSVENQLGDATIVLKEFSEGGSEAVVDTWKNVKNNEVNYWAYTPTIAGIRTLIIQSGNTELTIKVNIVPLGIDIKEVPDYAFKFKANEFASNSAIQNWNSNNVTANFSDNFDWINGGLKTEEYLDKGVKRSRQSIVIKAGTSMTINYKLFEVPAHKKGKTFKMIYKTTGCYDYDATFLNSKETRYIIGLEPDVKLNKVEQQLIKYSKIADLDENLNVVLRNPEEIIFNLSIEENVGKFNNSYIEFEEKIYYCSITPDEDSYKIIWRPAVAEENGVGLLMTAQTALIRSTSTKTSMPYCEDNYMEFEFDIWPDNGDTTFVQGWLDGVPCSIVKYPVNSEDFSQNNYMPITIGSPDCDVVLYLVKVYESHLTDEEHLTNFIADAPNAPEMLSRFKRNDILDDSGEISYEKLSKANPDCLVHLYDVDKIPKSKDSKDYVLVRNYEQYKNNELKLKAKDALYKIQGTSSAKYIVSAANIDTNFKPKEKHFKEAGYTDRVYTPVLEDGEGNDLLAQGGWAMDDKAIPCTYFCTKVNVASCEQANNSLNQEWYNQYQPYISSVRKKTRADGRLHRDTMQFKQGVIFMKDNNQTTHNSNNNLNNVFREVPGYVENPWYKMYSIGAMGNSKKNTHVFHDEDNPLECCIENGDNQLPGQWMTVPQGGYEKDKMFVAVDVMVDDIIENGDEQILCPDGEYRTAWDLWKTGMDEIYGFRYPDGIEEVLGEDNENWENGSKMIKAWYDFVKWMALNNPNPKYEPIEFKDENDFKSYASKLFIRNFEEDGSVKNHVEINVNESSYDINAKYFIPTSHIYGYTEEPLEAPQTFKVYKFSNSEYTSILAGTEIDTYQGTYTHDTYKYRMAKMLNECEEHLVMDSVVYHYLFIERHTMIDNVAKNTFWSSSDLKHWDLTKNYDNDTADGNDNQGKLTLTYGYEIGDLRNGVSVFNAPNSVWLNFIDGLYPARQVMYNKLDTGVWNEENYLNKFEEWQNIIPERCWIEDYRRKYIRPYTEYKDTMYFEMLEGGQKKQQRKQYEHYQNIYIDSEYCGSSTLSSYILIRGNKTGADLANARIPAKVYSDCYIWGGFGTGSDGVNMKQKVKRGETTYISAPNPDIADATIYLYPSQIYQQIGSEAKGEDGLEVLGVKTFSVANAPKLSKVVLGSYNSSTQNILLENVSFEGNPLLRELYICNYNSAAQIELDLSQATGLRILDTRNSSVFTHFTIANGAPIQSMQIHSPTSLVLHNLNKLETLNIAQYNKLSSIDLDNIDKVGNSIVQHSKNIIKNLSDLMDDKVNMSFSKYNLKNINWILDENEAEGSSNTPIHYLDFILKHSTIGGELETNALTGEILLNHSKYEGQEQYDIYKKYAITKGLSKLDIKFNPSNLYTVEIYDGNNSPIWTKKIIGSPDYTVNADFLSSGPNGAFDLTKIEKASSQQYTYEFTKTWELHNLDDPNAEVLILNRNNEEYNGLPIYDLEVKYNMRLVPIFNEEIRQYTLTFILDGDNNEDGIPPITFDIAYGTTRDFFLPNVIPYKNDSSLPLNETYSFKGFALMKNSSTPISADYYVQNNQTFYPLFEQINVHDNIHPEYFECVGFQEYIDNDNTSYNLYGVQLGLKSYVRGKITIPANFIGPDGNSYPVVSVNKSFRAYQNTNDSVPAFGVYLTHVFFEEGSQIRKFNDFAFAGDDAANAANNENETFSIQYIEYPNSLRVIGNSCFRRTRLNHYNIGNDSGTLWHIGNSAYRNAFGEGHRIEELKIASTVKRIDGAAFRALLNDIGTIDLITIGTADNPSLLSFAKTKDDKEVYEGEGSYIFQANPPDVVIGNLNIYLQNNDIEAAGGQDKFIDPQTKINVISIQP